MLFKQFYDPDLAQGSYLIGCQATGEAVVVDARRDISEYLDTAAANRMRIVAVTETHIHADYLSGSRQLAEETGARLLLSAEGGPDWLYRFPHEGLHDGDVIRVGNVSLQAVHTPGHTPEHLMFLVTDHPASDEPVIALTGDFVFVGDLGRPDLLDEAAGGVDTRFEGARQLFRSLQQKFINLPDYIQVWPGHGAGSACGRVLGAVASTTVGYESRFAWWAPLVQQDDEEGFVRELLSGQPDAPAYFGRMKRENRAGPDLLDERPALGTVNPAGHVLVDTRATADFNRGGLRGALHVPEGRKFVTYASYVLDPSDSLVLLARDQEHAGSMRERLLRVGLDNVAGYVTGGEQSPAPMVRPEELDSHRDAQVLDVRTMNEHLSGAIPGARQLHAGRAVADADTLDPERPLIVHCQSGVRATVVASALRARGFDARELEGSYPAWERTQTVTNS